ncbi:hypothetical protein [Saccharospirillum mangrovi]|uniref:hypothetical protein n=1 Tax=Saccharospirillum mangrovi TaxID=2161747 RepID=UPI000D3C5359|nr:hypothetical protein [Saccharospirillum mangrovi]
MEDFKTTGITELAAVVAEHLQDWDIEVVLVGGLAVEIYSQNLYLTQDIDLVNTNYQSPQLLSTAMAELGFFKQGRVYVNTTTDIVVEFPAAPLSVGDELITEINKIQVANKSLPILTVSDVIKDRLSAFLHWQDRQSLIQAVAVMRKHQQRPEDFYDFIRREGSDTEVSLLTALYQTASAQDANTMDELETILVSMLISPQ